MNNPHNTRAAADSHDSNAPKATTTQPTIQQPPAGSSKTQELRSHQGITIKWSLDSDSRRRIGAPFVAGSSPATPAAGGTGDGSC
jgi:hypothetical protein